ncbi:hypothetical protein [Actinocatenispora rupis]|uniref:Uncharacterized protein n=1 Tax=Actinocatenispora rupis TaxID=519421 RepID=A0A8J3NBW5_9ACTN|nr:hypothetical protein [Actinocatenispora rupis]GID11225.1 hypothetical protein Aru02nite_21140 [Actinocatenispora rupis]
MLDRTALLDGYPHNYLSVVGDRDPHVAWALMAAEYLQRFGWRLVTMLSVEHLREVHAVLYRESPRPAGGWPLPPGQPAPPPAAGPPPNAAPPTDPVADTPGWNP